MNFSKEMLFYAKYLCLIINIWKLTYGRSMNETAANSVDLPYIGLNHLIK